MTLQLVVTADPACNADPRKLAFWCDALGRQAAEFCATWKLPPVAVTYYSTDVLTKVDVSTFVKDSQLVTIQPTLDVQGALGFHDDIAGVIFARVMWQGDDTTITLSHEILEQLGDPTADAWAALGDGRSQALEACDRCEGDPYPGTGRIGDDEMTVQLSDYLLPSAFMPGSPGPWDKLELLTRWDETRPGGYCIIQQADGSTTDVSAQTEQARAIVEVKKARAWSRLARRLGL